MSRTVSTGRVALVSAGTAGLGLGCAEELVASGHQVMICGRDEDRLASAVRELGSSGGVVHGFRADVRSADDLQALYAEVDRLFGRLDVVVANAGGPPPGDLRDLDDATWTSAFELVVMSVVRSVTLAVPRMRAAGGRVVVIGSSTVRRAVPGLVLSNTLRPALAGLVKSLAIELAGDGITVNLVAPGRIETARVRALDEWNAVRHGYSADEERASSQASIPMGRYGRPRELGALVAFLASDTAGYITGQTVLVDGGLVPTLP